MSMRVGYCTNVHPATTVAELLQQWTRHTLAVRSLWKATDELGLGVWLPAEIVRELDEHPERGKAVQAFLDTHGLVPFTCNGFPYGDFHRPVVKHDVYFPTWWQPVRAEYTLRLVARLHEWLPRGEQGSISTLPIAWGFPPPTEDEWRQAAVELIRVARSLAELESRTGRHIVLALEPEPGCALQYSQDVLRFFDRYLWPLDAPLAKDYVTVCHDVCHASVMYESQEGVLRLYRDAGVHVGKIQVSAAVRMDMSCSSPHERETAYRQLQAFNEPKYLHQTVVCEPGKPLRFFEDLSLAMGYYRIPPAEGQWRVHFHIPIYLQTFGALATTNQEIRQCLTEVARHQQCEHFEVETYAWNVLPPELQMASLAEGIAQELHYFLSQWLLVANAAAG